MGLSFNKRVNVFFPFAVIDKAAHGIPFKVNHKPRLKCGLCYGRKRKEKA